MYMYTVMLNNHLYSITYFIVDDLEELFTKIPQTCNVYAHAPGDTSAASGNTTIAADNGIVPALSYPKLGNQCPLS